jgi:NAD(P)H-dependent FMN reductase
MVHPWSFIEVPFFAARATTPLMAINRSPRASGRLACRRLANERPKHETHHQRAIGHQYPLRPAAMPAGALRYADPQPSRIGSADTEGATMVSILGISGSLRAQSFNTALLRAARSVSGDGVHLEPATLHGIPLYDGDVEQREGTPPAVRALKEHILAHAGLLLVSPEYNNGIPGVFKNAIDWLSRPTPEMPDVLRDRPVAVIGASPGAFGTILGQAHWLPVLRTLGMRHYTSGRLMVSRAQAVFAADGSIQDAAVLKRLGEFVQGFGHFVAASRPADGATSKRA